MTNLNVKMPQRLDYDTRLEGLARWNKEHKSLLELSDNAGCYYCCNIYSALEIKEWIKSYRTKSEKPDCALCPRCGIDAVLPDIKVNLSVDLLKEMHGYWFNADSVALKMKNGEIVDIVDDGGNYDPQEFAKWRANQLEIFSEKRLKRNFNKFIEVLEKKA